MCLSACFGVMMISGSRHCLHRCKTSKLLLDLFWLNSDGKKTEGKTKWFHPKRKSVSWRAFLSKEVIHSQQKGLSVNTVCVRFANVSAETPLSCRNTLVVKSCSFQLQRCSPAGMKLLDVWSDCHQPVAWLKIPHRQRCSAHDILKPEM